MLKTTYVRIILFTSHKKNIYLNNKIKEKRGLRHDVLCVEP